MKTCNRCKNPYDESFFYKDSSSKDGLQGKCKDCSKETASRWNKSNPERVSERRKKYAEKELEYSRNYEANNKERRREKDRLYRERNREEILARRARERRENPGLFNSYASSRRSRKMNSTPSWADASKISDFYWWASEISRVSGIKHHVDHIVPLAGKTVCGLHCEDNLQIITAYENQSKGHYRWPGMNGFEEYANHQQLIVNY